MTTSIQLQKALITDWCKSHTAKVKLQYQVPELSEDGSCSLFDILSDTPFDLTEHLNSPLMEKLTEVQALVDWVKSHTDIEWFGIYVTLSSQLTKLAYYGNPSRAQFPLTKDFAKLSNNVHVALSGEKIIINDVDKHRENGGVYYTCDNKVKSELCWPIFSDKNHQQSDHNHKIIGIIDAESFKSNQFDNQHQLYFTAVCELLGEILTEPLSKSKE